MILFYNDPINVGFKDKVEMKQQAHSEDFEYTCVLTSCNRFDLLEKTLTSFFKYIDIQPKEFIIVEDSGNQEIHRILEKFDYPFHVIVNPKNLGQAKSIDIGYSQVKTPYIFHCEDDWEFYRTGFIAESLRILEHHKEVSLVQLRGRAEQTKLRDLPSLKLNNSAYFLAKKTTDKRYFSYGYNPSLRRLEDYQRIAPLADIGGEREVSWIFKQLGFVTAHLENPAVKHIGEERHIDDITAAKIGLNKLLRSWKNIFIRLKWKVTGFPHNR